ncbi:hypothetical protein JCM6882_004902 [Rhodosporidiobolus microsporus]
MAKHKRTASTSTSSTTPSRPLSHLAHHPLPSLVHLALRSAALLAVVGAALVLALAGWSVLRSATRVPLVAGRERVWLQYGEWRPPYADLVLDQRKYAAVRGQTYDLALELSVPVNDNNVALGNFMVSLSLLDGEGERVVNVSRPAILTHPSLSSSSSSPSSSSLFSLLNPLHLLRLPLSLLHPSSLLSSPSSALLCAQKAQTLLVPLLEGASLSAPPPQRRGWGSARRSAAGARVDRVWIEVGRRDAHDTPNGSSGFGGARKELQVFESWLRVETQLRGLRSIVHSHPYFSFALFLPSFLFLELVAALLVYTSYVLKPDSTFAAPFPFSNGSTSAAEDVLATTATSGESGNGYGTTSTTTAGTTATETGASSATVRPVKTEDESSTVTEGGSTTASDAEDEDVKPLLSPSTSRSVLAAFDAGADSPTFSASGDGSGSGSEEGGGEDLDPEVADRERARRMRLGRGGRGMSEVAPPSSREEEELEEDENEGAEVEEGVGEEVGEEMVGMEEEAVGMEEGGKDEGDGEGTVGGSETTARTRSTFGPFSVATTATTATGASGASASSGGSGGGLRSRGSAGGGAGGESG